MVAPPAGIPEADWMRWPPEARQFILAQQQENDELRVQLTALATELASLRERIGRSSRNSSKPPSSDGPGFKPPERRKGSGRKRGGQPGHPGSGPEPLPIERVDEVVEHHPEACRRCGTLLDGEDPAPLRHQVIEIPPITPLVIEHRLHRLVCPCCSTSTCATLPADVEASPYGPRLSALVGLLGSAFPLSFSKTQALLDQLLGVEISRGAIATIRQRLSAALAQPMAEALEAARAQPVAYVDETGAPTGNADGNNPTGKRGWQWVMVTAVVTVFIQGLSRSTAAAMELLGNGFGGIVVSDRFSVYNHLPLERRQICWAHVIRDLTAIAERPGASAEFGAELLKLQRQLFAHWHRCNKPAYRSARPLRPRCGGWWSWAIRAASERRGPKRSAPAGRSSKWRMPFGRSWRSVESSPPTTLLSVPCDSRSFNARSAMASNPAWERSAGADCSPSPPRCDNRAAMSGHSWSRLGLPITAAG